jgi:thiol:disulfide interchange protein
MVFTKGSTATPKTTSTQSLTAFSEHDELEQLMADFLIIGKKEGYVRSDEFKRFLEETEKGITNRHDRIKDVFQRHGLWTLIAAIMVILGGLGLNLTPCVLPMIPINIAIMGAGAGAESKKRGFALGGMYGGAIAMTYGLLGLFVVLTGSRFGTLNSSYIFNLIISVVFIVLSLGMFDIVTIDF